MQEIKITLYKLLKCELANKYIN